MWLKSNSVTDHRRIYNKNLSVSENKRARRGFDYPLVHYTHVESRLHVAPSGAFGPEWNRSAWKVRH